jgi:hypothetical protein
VTVLLCNAAGVPIQFRLEALDRGAGGRCEVRKDGVSAWEPSAGGGEDGGVSEDCRALYYTW